MVRYRVRPSKSVSALGMVVAGAKIIEDAGPTHGAPPLPFDDRLRRLEQLRKDGLVSDEEYQRKRAELLGEHW